MENEETVTAALNRIQWQLSQISQSLSWLAALAIAAALVVSCGPATDERSDLASCMAQSMLVPDVHFREFNFQCMIGKGHEYRWEADECGISSPALEGCFEKRGIWRSTRRFVVTAWNTLVPGRAK